MVGRNSNRRINKLDNRKQNLRYCPHAVNLQNCKIRTDNSSGCPGVYFLEKKKCWQVYINVKGKRINLGYFKEKEKAIEARKKAEQTYFEDKIPHV